ncbi:phosphonate C-P lyase system protein PhnG [Roseovarius sp. A46]|uniref:phosphonate C-P lyase system protein PhnG n=1 Tax=Roseovarius sp. A46 TaxID=2109331 RepID=UPI00101031E9|nr:phosphonate C-P lyase system protein PhnG [Roseovarius sp. A46]RXV60459.1 phosphonate C-P lyase system protein PhnG [Roseovarius sp. A46]
MGENSERKAWMGLLARAPADDLDRLWRATGLVPEHERLRAPEVGAVMVRGRAGAEGAAFNLGEMVVTRCAVRLGDGRVGHGHVQGRGKAHAEQAALIDALMQGGEAVRVREGVLDPLVRAEAARRAERAGKAAATKVDFFTLVRGED